MNIERKHYNNESNWKNESGKEEKMKGKTTEKKKRIEWKEKNLLEYKIKITEEKERKRRKKNLK